MGEENVNGGTLPEVVVTAPKNSPQSNQPDINVGPINQWQWNMQVKNTEIANKSAQASMDWKPYAGAGSTVVQKMYYSKKHGTWMGKNFKMYKQTWGGNKYTGGKNKFGKKMSGAMEWTGRGIGMWSAWNVWSAWRKNEISIGWMITEEASNAYSTFGGLKGAAWGIGWELGRTITNTEWYQKFKFNVMYDYWERKFGSPCESNEYLWIYFFENYK